MRRSIGSGSVSAIISGHQYAGDGYKVKASRFLLKDNLADTIEEDYYSDT